MWVRSIAAVAVSVGVIGVSGCEDSPHSCGVGDYKPTGQRGFATPRQVLRPALAVNPSLPQDGWRLASQGARAVEFRSGDDSVDVVKRSDGLWVIGAITNCHNL
jgi:hypothetical protein